MPETITTQLKAINFTADNFTGQQRVFGEIDHWLQKSQKRFFILTGEPGMKKSAIENPKF